MPKSKITEIEQRIGEDLGDYLRREYEQNHRATKSIGDGLNTGKSTVRRWLKRYEIPLRDSSEAKLQKDVIKLSKEELEKVYVQEHKTPYDIGRQFNVGQGTVRGWLRGYKIPIRDASEARLPKGFIKPTKEELEKVYVQEHRTPKDIGNQLGVSIIKIKSLLIEYAIPIRGMSESKLPKGVVEPSKEKLERLYLNEHKSPYDIGRQFNVNNGTAISWLKEYEIPIRGISEAMLQKGVVKPSKEELEKMYVQEHRTLEDIGGQSGISISTMRSWLSGYKIPIRSVSETLLPKFFVKPSKEELEKMYVQEHRAPNDIGDQLGVGNTTIKRWLIEFRIPIRSSSESQLPNGFVKPTKEDLEEMYVQDHKSLKDIGDQLDVSNIKIKSLLIEYEIPIRDASESNLPKGVVKPSKEKLENMLEDNNMSLVAKEIGVSMSTVYRWTQEYGIKKETVFEREELESLLEKYISEGA